jgi:thiamine pyrophosphate-dependent acetolactate synthase large subunit-like protein
MWRRCDALERIFRLHGENAVYVTSTGYISRAVYSMHSLDKNIFYMQGSMGLSPAIGIGIALYTSKDVVVISGDASLLMHLGITHTLRDLALPNLYVYILDNKCHESVGGYPSPALEEKYPGVNQIMSIFQDGKEGRVGLSCEENTHQLKEFL